MTLTRVVVLIVSAGKTHESGTRGPNSNMIHSTSEVRVWRGRIPPKHAGKSVGRLNQPFGTRRRCSRLASPVLLLLLQDPSARHLRDTCWPCARLAVNHLLQRDKLAVLSRLCNQAVCPPSYARQQTEPRRHLVYLTPTARDHSASRSSVGDHPDEMQLQVRTSLIRCLRPVRWAEGAESAQGWSTFVNSLHPVGFL